MKKMSTLFKIDYSSGRKGKILNEVNTENSWVFTDEAVTPTRKFDGTAACIIDGVLYKRYDAKHGKTAPEGAIPCSEPDIITGHHPHWVKCTESDKYFLEAFAKQEVWDDGTYELCGPKVGINIENFVDHTLVKHGCEVLPLSKPYTFESIRVFLQDRSNNIEGIVFHGKNGNMCKIRKSDFGVKREK